MKYTKEELAQSRMSDLHVEALCAEADGLADYAALCRDEIAALRVAHPSLALLDYAAEYTLEQARNRQCSNRTI